MENNVKSYKLVNHNHSIIDFQYTADFIVLISIIYFYFLNSQ